MGGLFILLLVWFIVIVVGFIIERKYQAQMKALVDEINALRAKHHEAEAEKDYLTNYQGQNENETYTWKVENKK